MCGIVGYVGDREVVPLLLDGLRKLEYRGYDSAGVVVRQNGVLNATKVEGKLDRLAQKLADHPLQGSYGLGHTRWATHGVPSERNAHPVFDARERVALIHNGIIENFLEIKRRLMADGWEFATDTDTEVVANLVSSYLDDDLREAVARATEELEGMYAIAVVSIVGERDEIVATRNGPPLVLGVGEGEHFLASDPMALLAYTKNVVRLENRDIARISRGELEMWNSRGETVHRPVEYIAWDAVQAEKGGYKHFMLKEIHEQPQAVQDTLAGHVDFEQALVGFEALNLTAETARSFRRIHLLACGTSWHSALVGKFMLEELVGLPVEVDYGSEYRYRNPIVGPEVMVVGISQSGETADTLSAMEAAREKGAPLYAICNVKGSQVAHLSEGVIYTHAGPEIGVASTKAFTTQLVALYMLALRLAQLRGGSVPRELFSDLAHLPQAVNQALAQSSVLKRLARRFFRAQDFLYLGRGINYPIALEGALKLKEISYIHAEGYPAGEMKHGPIALIDEDLPVVAIATGERVFEKVKSNMQEVKARDGVVVAITDRDPDELGGVADEVVRVPSVSELLQPVVNVVPLQLLAYFVGVRRGADVDQPRNLAKSVTVE